MQKEQDFSARQRRRLGLAWNEFQQLGHDDEDRREVIVPRTVYDEMIRGVRSLASYAEVDELLV